MLTAYCRGTTGHIYVSACLCPAKHRQRQLTVMPTLPQAMAFHCPMSNVSWPKATYDAATTHPRSQRLPFVEVLGATHRV